MKYAPSSAASCLKSQGSSTTPHGPGGKVPRPMDSVGKGGGMGYSPKTAAHCLDEWGRAKDAPGNAGPQKSY